MSNRTLSIFNFSLSLTKLFSLIGLLVTLTVTAYSQTSKPASLCTIRYRD